MTIYIPYVPERCFISLHYAQLLTNKVHTSKTMPLEHWWHNTYSSTKHVTTSDQMEQNTTIDSILKGPLKEIWEKSLSNEWG